MARSSLMDVTGTLRDWTPCEYRYVVTVAAASPRLDIRLLGPPEILVDGAPLVVDTRKAVAILALLGAEGRAFARDELAAMLWPDADQAAAHGALRRTLSTLRAATGDSVVADRTRVVLASAAVRVDVAELERLAASGTRRSLAAAAGLARGPFLAGFNLRDSADFDDWRATRAAALERTVMSVLDRLAGAHEAAGDLSAAIGAASRRLDLDPLDEAGHVRLMDLFARSGDRAAALRQYRSCVAILDRELGVAPLASTTARYEAIRDADVPAGPPTTSRRSTGRRRPLDERIDARRPGLRPGRTAHRLHIGRGRARPDRGHHRRGGDRQDEVG
jgi:DNA-binding SARP family transcriptional activator